MPRRPTRWGVVFLRAVLSASGVAAVIMGVLRLLAARVRGKSLASSAFVASSGGVKWQGSTQSLNSPGPARRKFLEACLDEAARQLSAAGTPSRQERRKLTVRVESLLQDLEKSPAGSPWVNAVWPPTEAEAIARAADALQNGQEGAGAGVAEAATTLLAAVEAARTGCVDRGAEVMLTASQP